MGRQFGETAAQLAALAGPVLAAGGANKLVSPEVWPLFADCYCYSTDYPHFEGGEDSMRLFYEQVAPLGDAIVDKSFRTNGQLLLTD